MNLSPDTTNPPACLGSEDEIMMDFFGFPTTIAAFAPNAFDEFEERPGAPASSSSSPLESLKLSDACNSAPTSLLRLLRKPQQSSATSPSRTPELLTNNNSSPQSPQQTPQTPRSASGSGPQSPPSPSSATHRFKAAHENKWSQRIKELQHFRSEHGHCSVPHLYPSNPQLARWVKRQRRQHKLLLEGKASALSPERVTQLEDLGFVWDSHDATWTEKVGELRAYRAAHGNCQVPSTFKKNPQLAVWVKCQRRQYKLFWEGRKSAMTMERIAELEKEGFCWEVRSGTGGNKVSQARGITPTSVNLDPTPALSGSKIEDFESEEIKLLLDSISHL